MFAPEGAKAAGPVENPIEDAMQRPDVDAFHERAAIAEYDGGLDREEAEVIAARSQGFASPSALFSAASASWSERLARIRPDRTGAAALSRMTSARAFVGEGWAAIAAAFGWCELELFGVSQHDPWAGAEQMGAAFLGPVHAVSADVIAYRCGYRRWRAGGPSDPITVWEMFE